MAKFSGSRHSGPANRIAGALDRSRFRLCGVLFGAWCVAACGTTGKHDSSRADGPHGGEPELDAGLDERRDGESVEGVSETGTGTGGTHSGSRNDAGQSAGGGAGSSCAPGAYVGTIDAKDTRNAAHTLHCDLRFSLAAPDSGARLNVSTDASLCQVPKPDLTGNQTIVAGLVGTLDCGTAPATFLGRVGADAYFSGTQESAGRLGGSFQYTFRFAGYTPPITEDYVGTWSADLQP